MFARLLPVISPELYEFDLHNLNLHRRRGAHLSAMTSYAVCVWTGACVTDPRVLLAGMSIPANAAIVPAVLHPESDGPSGKLLVRHIRRHIVFAYPHLNLHPVGFFYPPSQENWRRAAVMTAVRFRRCFLKLLCRTRVSSIVTVAVIDFVSIWKRPAIFRRFSCRIPIRCRCLSD